MRHRSVAIALPCLFAAVLVLAFAPAAAAQPPGLTLPPSGDNQRTVVTQQIGPVEVTIDYSSPDVTAPGGEDRRGKMWGQLVPYGMANLGFGSCGEQCPWRAGANFNTTLTVSHDVLVEGQPLAAGTYGLHMIPGQERWTLILSRNAHSWGSFFYDPAEDALRVEVTPRAAPYSHWLDYEFLDRGPDRATVALQWEELEVPWTIAVPNVGDLYAAALRDDLRTAAGFSWTNWAAAAQWAIGAERPAEAVEWAQAAAAAPFIGQENFQTLSTLARAQALAGQAAESDATLLRAVDHPTADVFQVHQLGRTLLGEGRAVTAMLVFEKNAERHGDAWPVHVGLMRGHSALGRYAQALEHARKALPQAPDDVNRTSLETAIGRLEKGEDVN
jgi:Flp pilus assembly protein TadD